MAKKLFRPFLLAGLCWAAAGAGLAALWLADAAPNWLLALLAAALVLLWLLAAVFVLLLARRGAGADQDRAQRRL